MIHNAKINKESPREYQGFGFSIKTPEDILHCVDKEVTILYSGALNSSQTAKLPIFAPRITSSLGTVQITWTITTIVNPNIHDPDAYTTNCIEDTFFPHSENYRFTKDGKKNITLNLLSDNSNVKLLELLNDGYRQSDLPRSHPQKKNWAESDLRKKELKWDTVIKKTCSMRSSSLFNPFLTLHAIGRNGYEYSEIEYHVVVTIAAKEYQGSLYDAILQTYPNLSPIEIHNVNRVLVEA